MKKILWVLVVGLWFASGCRANPEVAALQAGIALTQTAIASFTPNPILPTPSPASTHTPYPTYTPPPTQTPLVVVVTATGSPTPAHTATFTSTATRTPTPLPTLNFLQMNKGAGNYLVNVEIAPGVWKNNSALDNCNWKRATRSGNTIAEYSGKGGGTLTIAASDYRVEMDWNCGIWYFLGSN